MTVKELKGLLDKYNQDMEIRVLTQDQCEELVGLTPEIIGPYTGHTDGEEVDDILEEKVLYIDKEPGDILLITGIWD